MLYVVRSMQCILNYKVYYCLYIPMYYLYIYIAINEDKFHMYRDRTNVLVGKYGGLSSTQTN